MSCFILFVSSYYSPVSSFIGPCPTDYVEAVNI